MFYDFYQKDHRNFTRNKTVDFFSQETFSPMIDDQCLVCIRRPFCADEWHWFMLWQEKQDFPLHCSNLFSKTIGFQIWKKKFRNLVYIRNYEMLTMLVCFFSKGWKCQIFKQFSGTDPPLSTQVRMTRVHAQWIPWKVLRCTDELCVDTCPSILDLIIPTWYLQPLLLD